MAAAALRSVQLGVLVVVAFLCVVSVAGNGENEAGAMVAGIPTRHLLQTVNPCPVDFSTQNYTIVTSVCNATNPNITACCDAFVILVCPFASYINDATTNCNLVMFSYLNMAGQYPPQLFQACLGGVNGLPCPLVPEPSPNPLVPEPSPNPLVPEPSPNPLVPEPSPNPLVPEPSPNPSSATMDMPKHPKPESGL